MFSRYYFEDIISLDIIDEIEKITCEDVHAMLNYFDLDLTTTHLVLPK